MIINNIIIKWGRRRANLQRLMNWWCLKGCCNSPLVMCNFASRSKALRVFCQKIPHSDMERLSQSPQAPSDWPHAGADLMRAHYILSEPKRMQTFHLPKEFTRCTHSHTRTQKHTHSVSAWEGDHQDHVWAAAATVRSVSPKTPACEQLNSRDLLVPRRYMSQW